MRVLVVAPHPDDEAIGCGGALLRRREAGDDVHVVFLTSGEMALPHLDREKAWSTREAEADAAAQVLGVEDRTFLRLPDWTLEAEAPRTEEALAGVIARTRPEVLYAPHDREWHPDHRAALAATRAATARCGLPGWAVLRYEVWTPMAEFDTVEDITEVMEGKLEAIRCYASQLGAFDYLRAATGLGGYRGALAARSDYAEVFERCPA